MIAITIADSTKMTIRTWTRSRSGAAPTPRLYSMIACRSAIATACTRVSASSLRIARLVSDLTVSALRPIRRRDLLRVEPSASSWRISRSRSDSGASAPTCGHQQRGRQRGVHERLAADHRADRPQQVLGRRALHHVAARAGGDRVREQALVAVGGEHDGLHVGRRLGDALDRGDAVDARQPHVHDHDLGLQPLDGLDDLLAALDVPDQLEVGVSAEHQAEPLAHRGMVVDGQAPGRLGHRATHYATAA